MRIYCTPLGFYHVLKEVKKNYPLANIVCQKGILSQKETESKIKNEKYLIIGSEKISNKFLSNSSLKAIARFGGSLENIDISKAKELGIDVFSFKSTKVERDVANIAVSFTLMAAYNILELKEKIKKKKWFRPIIEGTTSKIAILGTGNIGKRIYSKLKYLGFLNTKKYSLQKIMNSKDVKYEFKKILSSNDIVLLNGSLKAWSTKYFISELSKIKKPIQIINTARGLLVNQKKILTLIQKKKIKYYYTDVFETEPPDSNTYKFILSEKIFCTPHIGGYGKEALIDVANHCMNFFYKKIKT